MPGPARFRQFLPDGWEAPPVIDLTLLGCGGTQPLPDRALSALCLTVGGSSLLIDCGEGTQAAARPGA